MLELEHVDEEGPLQEIFDKLVGLFVRLFDTCIVLYLLIPLLFVFQDLIYFQFYTLDSGQHSKYPYFLYEQEFSLDQ